MKRDLTERYRQQQFEKRIVGCDEVEDLPILCNETPTPDHILELKEHLIHELRYIQSLDNLEYGELRELITILELKERAPAHIKELRTRLVELGVTQNLDDLEYEDLKDLIAICERRKRIELNKDLKKESL